MEHLKGACIIGQSGGPTAVINASAQGVIQTALADESITRVLGAAHGIKGVLADQLYDMGREDPEELALLSHTPSSALGSCRYKLADPEVDDTDYRRILEVFQKHDVRYFFYNRGNDSMDTCSKISRYLQKVGYPCNVIGVPKTIDNDLSGTDHCPGYGSAAKYIANSIMEINRDASIYPSPLVVVVEIMGRNAGWLTAASKLASVNGFGADLIYLPETPFSYEKFLSDVKTVVDAKKYCVVAVSEGIRFENGKYVGEDQSSTDVFGHSQLGGVCSILKAKAKSLGLKCKAVELNILQRCAAHCASDTDIEESVNAGRQAVKKAVNGETDKMIAFRRKPGETYEIEYVAEPLSSAANAEKQIPAEWITADGTNLTDDFVAYALPLIAGEPNRRLKNGLPVYAKLKNIKFKL